MWPLPDFKSLVPGVESAEDISERVGIALVYQCMFERRTCPWEADLWHDKDLMNFCVELKHIDRVYAIEFHEDNDDYSGGDYYLLARVWHQGRHLFVELSGSCDASGFVGQGGGELYVTGNANVFYNVVACELANKDAVLASLVEDGYDIVPQTSASTGPVASEHNPSRLMFMCHETVRDNQQCLAHYPAVLPPTLANSLDEFIRVREAMDDFS